MCLHLGHANCSAAGDVVMSDAYAEGVSGEEFAQLHQRLKAVKLNSPERWSGEQEKKGQSLRGHSVWARHSL